MTALTTLQVLDLEADHELDRQALSAVSGGLNFSDLGVIGGNASTMLQKEGGGVRIFSPEIIFVNNLSINPVVQVANIFDQTLTTNITNVLNSAFA